MSGRVEAEGEASDGFGVRAKDQIMEMKDVVELRDC